MSEMLVTDSQRAFLEDLGRTARSHLPHMEWDEVEPHLRLGWYSSVLSNDLDRAMFREFAKGTEYPSDLAVVRSIEPATLDLAEWIRDSGWSARYIVAVS